MERKSFFVRFLMVFGILFIVGLFIFIKAGLNHFEREEVLKKFRFAVAVSLDKLVEATNEDLTKYAVRIQKVEIARKEYAVVFLLEKEKPKKLISGVLIDRLKNQDDIKAYAQEAAEVIFYVIYTDAVKNNPKSNRFNNKRGRYRPLFKFTI